MTSICTLKHAAPPQDLPDEPKFPSTEEWTSWIRSLHRPDFAGDFHPLPTKSQYTGGLPAPVHDGLPSIRLYALHTGTLTCPASWFLLDDTSTMTMPCVAFLVEHTQGSIVRRVLFDGGLRRKDGDMAPGNRKMYEGNFNAKCTGEVYDLLEQNGISRDIEAIAPSHHHWDHQGDISRFPKSVSLVLGFGSSEETVSTDFDVPVEAILGRKLRILNEKENWLHVGSMRGVDYFGDGTFVLLHAPGHVKGHQAALVRMNSDFFFLLGGDLCHHCKLLDGSAQIGIFDKTASGQPTTMQANPEEAYKTIAATARMQKEANVVVWLSHDPNIAGKMGSSTFLEVKDDLAHWKF